MYDLKPEDDICNFDDDLSKYSNIREDDYDGFRFDLPKLFLAMWLELRSKYNKQDFPEYKKSENLKGLDLKLYDTVYEKIVHN